MAKMVNRLEIEIMSQIKMAGRARVTPTEENMSCAAGLCDLGLMTCEKVNGRAFYSLTDEGRESLEVATIKAGDKVLWLYTARTGWNFSAWVPATVVKTTAKRVTIDTVMKDGGTVRRFVRRDKLKLLQA